jgi:hypothetical protein
MSEQEFQKLLHESPSVEAQERPTGKTVLYSIGFIFGFKLRQKLRTVNERELELYITHLRSVSAMREYNRGSLACGIAWRYKMYVFKELKKTSRQLAKSQKKTF